MGPSSCDGNRYLEIRLCNNNHQTFNLPSSSPSSHSDLPLPPFSQDTLSDIHLNARLAEEVDQAEEDMGSIISDDPDSGPIVRPEYWERFRSVMDKLNEADGDSRTAMMVSWLQRLTFRF